MLVGYERVRPVDQVVGLEAQERDLTAARAGKLFSEGYRAWRHGQR
jgi:hypothetical protein